MIIFLFLLFPSLFTFLRPRQFSLPTLGPFQKPTSPFFNSLFTLINENYLPPPSPSRHQTFLKNNIIFQENDNERRGIVGLENDECRGSYVEGVEEWPFSVYVEQGDVYYQCNGSNVSESVYVERSEVEECVVIGYRRRRCVCSLERVGEKCQFWRNAKCVVKLIEPERECRYPSEGEYEQAGLRLFGFHNCIRFKSTDTGANFTFNMDCYFDENHNYFGLNSDLDVNRNFTIVHSNENKTWDEIQNEIFRYSKVFFKNESVEEYIDIFNEDNNPRFALHWSMNSQFIRMKPYNFNHLGKTTGIEDKYIMNDFDIYNKKKNFTFTLNFTMFDKSYFTGNRFYFEVGPKWGGIPLRIHEKVYVDFVDLELNYVKPTDWVQIISITSLSVAAAIILIIIILFFVIRHYLDKKKEKNN